MPYQKVTIALSVILSSSFLTNASAEGLFLRNLHTLDDEYRGYCLDIPGARERINRDSSLGARACKYIENNVDQMFEWVAPDRIRATEYENLCLAADRFEEGGELYVQDCSTAANQKWSLSADGRLGPAANVDLCVTLSEDRRITNSPAGLATIYHSRDLSLAACSASAAPLQQFRWAPTDEQERLEAHQLGDDIPAELAAAIRRVTEQGATAGATSELYVDQARSYELVEIDVASNLAYGPHERHVLDVHTDTRRNGDELRPVIMYFHGGGFVRGNKDGNRNVADYFSSLGLVGVNATYRLAPEAKWPDGAHDVAAAVDWVQKNISDHGGDPDQIYVIGKSAAAAHVATYAYRPDVFERDARTAAGVILVSGTYGADPDTASEGRISYFGDDFANWHEISTIGNVDRTTIPAMFVVSEFDNDGVEESMLDLISELTGKQGSMPRVLQLIGHNHYSSDKSIGTQDTQLSSAILQFVMSNASDGETQASH